MAGAAHLVQHFWKMEVISVAPSTSSQCTCQHEKSNHSSFYVCVMSIYPFNHTRMLCVLMVCRSVYAAMRIQKWKSTYYFVILRNVTENKFPFSSRSLSSSLLFYCVGDMIKANKRANNVCILSDEAFCVSLPDADTNIGTFGSVDCSNSISLFCLGCVATERRAMSRTMVCRHIASFDFVSIYLFDLILDPSHFFYRKRFCLHSCAQIMKINAIQQVRQSYLTIELIPKRIVRPIVRSGQLSINGVVLHLCRE